MRCAIRNSLLRKLIQNYHNLIEEKYTDIAPRLAIALEQNKKQSIKLEIQENTIEWISMLHEDLNARVIRDTEQLQSEVQDL